MHHPLCERCKTNPEDERHGRPVFPGVENARVVPLAEYGIGKTDCNKGRLRQDRQFERPAPRSKKQRRDPESSQQNEAVSDGPEKAFPNHDQKVPGVAGIERRLQHLPYEVYESAPQEEKDFGILPICICHCFLCESVVQQTEEVSENETYNGGFNHSCD